MFILIIAILISIGIIYYLFNQNNNNSENQGEYETQRTSTNNDNKNDNLEENSNNDENTEISSENPQLSTEKTIATFSTKIYSTDTARQNNINITCNTLNNTTVKKGETFSFCNTVGPASSSKGYQKADIFDKNGNKKKGLGGGNCQISSTLYNAVTNVPNLIIIERHEHSNNVPYVQKGKDAAVAYGSYDFKFRNDTGNDIKITCSTDGTSVTTNLISI